MIHIYTVSHDGGGVGLCILARMKLSRLKKRVLIKLNKTSKKNYTPVVPRYPPTLLYVSPSLLPSPSSLAHSIPSGNLNIPGPNTLANPEGFQGKRATNNVNYHVGLANSSMYVF